MKSNYLLIYFLLLSAFGFSQTYDIGGQVKETGTGLPLPGVNIQVKNSTKGTSSDLDGNFSLKDIPSGSTVVFTYVGFSTFEYTVTGNNASLSVSLSEDTKSLDEVVVIGYGSQKKREVTGSVSVVNAKTLEKFKPLKASSALQGTVTGVIVTGGSGKPNAGSGIKIRGVGSNGDNAPTVIVDGYQGSLDDLNPSDIETITVLKDAQAAIYGVIGANGVILVTTKTGKKNTQPKITYNGQTGFQEATRKLPLLNATEYALLLNESYANGGQMIPFPNVNGLGKGTDWQDELFRKGAPVVMHDFSVSGGSDKVTYAISASDVYQEGTIGTADKSRFKRNTARIQLGFDVNEKLKFNTNVMYTYFNSRDFNDNGLGSVLFNAVNLPATIEPYDTNGDFTLVPSTGLGIEIINPLAQLENTFNDGGYKKINGTFGLDYEVIKGLTLTSRIGFTTGNGYGKSFAKQVDYKFGKVFNVDRSRVDQNKTENNNYTFDIYLTYKKSLAETHNFTFTLGNTIYKEWGSGLYASAYDVPNNSWQFADISLALGFNSRDVSSYVYDERRLSYFGRAQYDYKGKYLISAMYRRDASTKFGPKNTIAYFPSMTAGWVISEEGFFSKNSLVNFMKMRLSYGSLGNDLIGNNRYSSLLNGEATYVFDNVLTSGTAIGVLANPHVAWEKAKKFDIGLDLNLYNDKFKIVADYYNDVRDNLLIGSLPTSATAGGGAPGSGAPTVNAGSTRNTGFEFAINYAEKVSENFSIDLNYNITTINNEVTEVKNLNRFSEGGNFGVGQSISPARMEVGEPIGYFYGYQADGIFQNSEEVAAHPSQLDLGADAQPGDIRFKDINGDGVLDTNDRVNLGDPIPDMIMGFNLSMNYKGFDFAAFTYASIGNDIVRNYERVLPDVNRMTYVLDRWTGEGTSNTVPRVTTAATSNNIFSSYFVEDGSYFRIQNVQLGYTVNPDFTGKAGISKLRLYASVNNLYTFTKYRGYDPAAIDSSPLGGGFDNGTYPASRTYMLGVNINF